MLATSFTHVIHDGGTAMNETLDVLGVPMMVKSDGNGIAAFVADHPVPPGHFVPPHRHQSDDEMLYVVEGELTLIGQDGESKVRAGTSAAFRRGELHGYRNDGAAAARLIVVAAPGIQAAEMFRHFDRAARQQGGPLEPSQVAAIAGEYGVTFG
jgi:quercetin dioxygenase-like cupin family protein